MPFASIGSDFTWVNCQQKTFFVKGTNFYQLTSSPGGAPRHIIMQKSTDFGATWNIADSVTVHQGFGGGAGFFSSLLLLTKLYVAYPDPASVGLPFGVLIKYFDFTDDSFHTVVLAGGPTTNGNLGLFGTSAGLLYLVTDTNYTAIASGPFTFGKFVANVFSALGTVSDAAHAFFNIDGGIEGASGIIHLISTGSTGGSSPGSLVDLCYLPVIA
jgi:hypothetical protein